MPGRVEARRGAETKLELVLNSRFVIEGELEHRVFDHVLTEALVHPNTYGWMEFEIRVHSNHSDLKPSALFAMLTCYNDAVPTELDRLVLSAPLFTRP
jgi:hypothetical protein